MIRNQTWVNVISVTECNGFKNPRNGLNVNTGGRLGLVWFRFVSAPKRNLLEIIKWKLKTKGLTDTERRRTVSGYFNLHSHHALPAFIKPFLRGASPRQSNFHQRSGIMADDQDLNAIQSLSCPFILKVNSVFHDGNTRPLWVSGLVLAFRCKGKKKKKKPDWYSLNSPRKEGGNWSPRAVTVKHWASLSWRTAPVIGLHAA